jgi:hypothetical protein
MRRRQLGGIVLGTIVVCALILVAAVIARVSHASSPKESKAVPSALPALALPAAVAAPGALAQTAPPPLPPAEVPITGTLRFERPASPGRVWLDGKKLNANSALVSCGAHQIKVGRGRARSVQVPCGGDLVVSK